MSTETSECNVCGREFDNPKSKAAHMGRGHDEPWRDKQTLRKEYIEKGRSSYELADEWGCDPKTVRNWLNQYDIETREAADYNRNEYASYRVFDDGYCVWYDYYGESRGDSISVHRLLAIAKFGINEVKGKHTHHKNGIKWDNRPDNIELMSPSEHAKEHYERGDLELSPRTPVEELQGGQ